MAAKKPVIEQDGGLNTVVIVEDTGYKGPKVTVLLPRLEDSGDEGIQVDQYEHVTIANEKKETCYKVLRGEPVDVPVPVFIELKKRYPKL
jgi:hypothetical protein